MEIYANIGQGHLILILYDNEGQKPSLIVCFYKWHTRPSLVYPNKRYKWLLFLCNKFELKKIDETCFHVMTLI